MEKHTVTEEAMQMISSVDWKNYETAYGSAEERIPASLINLFSDNEEAALQASHALWCGLCHQHAFVSSAALPAFDILIYALGNVNDRLKTELLDIFYGFAICTSGSSSPSAWQGQLRAKLKKAEPLFRRLTTHQCADIAAFAEEIVSEL